MNNIGLSVENYTDQDLFISPKDVNDIKEDNVAEKKFTVIKIIFCVLCFLLICELVCYKYIMPSLKSPAISVSGHKMYTAEQIGEKLSQMSFSNWFDFDVNQAVAILSSESGIDNVMVEKKFPDKINIRISERVPVALTFISEGGKTSPINVDRNGFLFTSSNKGMVNDKIIPIISGLPVEYMASGRRIPATYRTLIEQIALISELPQNYFASISEISVISKDAGNYELVLIPSQSKVRVLTDRTLNEDALKGMMIALDVINQLGTDVSEVDLRYGAFSYRRK